MFGAQIPPWKFSTVTKEEVKKNKNKTQTKTNKQKNPMGYSQGACISLGKGHSGYTQILK
jgi:hypothetical protein